MAVLRHRLFRDVIDQLQDEEIFLPLERFYHQEPPGSFIQKIETLYDSGARLVVDAFRTTRHQLVGFGQSIRDDLEREYLQLSEGDAETSNTAQRFRLQRARFLLNRLLYLLPFHRFGDVMQILQQREPELLDQREVLQALATGNVDTLLKMPGNAVVAYATHHRRRQLPRITLPVPLQFTQAVVSSLSILLLFGICDPLSARNEEGLYPSAKDLFHFCNGNLKTTDMELSQNYLSELAGLSINKRREDIQEALTTAFSIDEEYTDEGLTLGDPYYVYV